MSQPVERGPQRQHHEPEGHPEADSGASVTQQSRHSMVEDLQEQTHLPDAGAPEQQDLPREGFEAGDQKHVDQVETVPAYNRPPPFFASLSTRAEGSAGKTLKGPPSAPEETAHAGEAEKLPEIIRSSVATLIEDDPRSFLRVTIMQEDRRGDLLLPGNIPVAEILPSVVRKFTSLTPRKVTQGIILVSPDGSTLVPGKTLFGQGVTDGAVLSLASRVKEREKKYDDIVEAVADAAEEFNKPWTPQNTATSAVAFMGVLVLASLFILLQLRRDVGIMIPIVTGIIAVLHLGLAWVLQGAGRAWHAVTIALLGSIAAGVTGLAISTAPLNGLPAVFGGLAAVLVAALALPLLKQWRELLVIPIIVGSVVAMIAGLHIAFEVSIPTISVTLAGIIGIAILAVPQISIRVSGLNRSKDKIDTKRTRELYARGHRLWIAFWISATLTLLLVAIPTVQTGKFGIAVMALNTLLMAMGSRKSFARIDVLLQYVGALAVFVMTAVSVVLFYPDWWHFVIVALLLVVIGTAAFGLILGRTWAWTKRVTDIAEMSAAVLLIPATVLAMELW